MLLPVVRRLLVLAVVAIVIVAVFKGLLPTKLPSFKKNSTPPITALPPQTTNVPQEIQTLLKTRLEIANEVLRLARLFYEAGVGTEQDVLTAMQRVLNSELELASKPSEQIAIRQKMVEVAKQEETNMQLKEKAGVGTRSDVLKARYFRLGIEIELLTAKQHLNLLK